MGNRSRFRKPRKKNGPVAEQEIVSMPFVVCMYVLLPTTAIGGLVVYYFYAHDDAMRGMAIILGTWVVLRSFTTATKRWLGKPIPTNKAAAHVARLYFLLIATLIPYLVAFSCLYYSFSAHHANSCTNVPLTKMSSLYFTTTIFSTTGFGDIHVSTPTCQAWATAQMVSGFVIISILIASFVSRLLQLINTEPGAPELNR